MEFEKIRRSLSLGKCQLEDVVRACIDNIEQRNKDINAVVTYSVEDALKRAKEIQVKINRGTAGALAGAIFGIKDNIAQKNYPLTCASHILSNFKSTYNATVLQKIIDNDGILLSRTNMDEFGMGSSNENSIYGAVCNPHNLKYVSGGSSGGSAAAVASNMVNVALGSDTGGSVRQPSAFCGLVGLKPSYGRISRYGLVAFASSLEGIGIISNRVMEAATVLSVIAGIDPQDSTSVNQPVPHYENILENSDDKLRIGVVLEGIDEYLDENIKSEIKHIVDKMKKRGHTIVPMSLPYLKYSIPIYYILCTAEASSNLARYDGVRYGYRSDETNKKQENLAELDEMYINTRTQGFGTEVKRRIIMGTYVLSYGYYDAYYKKAQKIRRLMSDAFKTLYKKVDVILSPVTISTAFPLRSGLSPIEMYMQDIYTVSANLTGNCAISVPIGFHKKNRMPIGVQLMANAFEETKLLRAAYEVEKLVS